MMGLAIRVIPTILNKHGNLVKGRQFASDRVVGNAMQATRIYAARGVDEICFLDVAATPEGRGPDLKMIEQLTDKLFAPVTYGGGVKSQNDIRQVLKAGADKVAICSGVLVEGLLGMGSFHFGSQAIVAVVDVKDGQVATQCGKCVYVDASPVDWARTCEHQGAGEILLQSIDRDGTMQGYDLDLIRAVSNAVSIPVIASGGCSGPEDMLRAIEAGASAVAAGALFLFTENTPKSCAAYLASKGIEVRT